MTSHGSSKSKKYRVIVKVSNERFVRYAAVNNLLRFTDFLDSSFPDWRFMNVYDYLSGDQIGSYTRLNRPTSRFM